MNDTEDIKSKVVQSNLKHIAVIMDGNRRWAKKRFLPAAAGHTKGTDALRETIKACINFGIKYLTVYAFSTENMNRSKEEVDFLMSLLSKTIETELPNFLENDIKVKFIGKPILNMSEINRTIKNCEEKTKNNKTLNLQIAFNYGSRAEITDACASLCEKIKNGEITEISEDTIAQNLYTANIPDPDLLIRTGGEKRISNFLLWQCAYSEIYVTEQFWPDFDGESLKKAVSEFYKRNRRFGK